MVGIGSALTAPFKQTKRQRSSSKKTALGGTTVIQDGIEIPDSAMPAARVAPAPFEVPILTPAGSGTMIPGTEMARPASTGMMEVDDQRGPIAISDMTGGIRQAFADNAAKPKPGMLNRLNDWVKSDEGRGALIRSAGATLQGGLGAGITAGAAWVDGRNEREEKKRAAGLEEGLRARGVAVQEQNADTATMNAEGSLANEAARLGISVAELEERRENNRGQRVLQGRGQDVTMRGQNMGLTDNREQRDVTVRGQNIGLADNREQRGVQRELHTTPSGNAILGNSGEMYRAGIGSKSNGPVETIVETTPAVEAENNWFSDDVPARGEIKRTVVTPLAAAPQAVTTPGQGFEPPTPESIALLKSNPGLIAQFEQRFGPGSAAQYLGGR